MELNNINFELEKTKHISFKSRLRTLVGSGDNVDHILPDLAEPDWAGGTVAADQATEVQQAVQLQAQLRGTVQRIIACCKAGSAAEAQAELAIAELQLDNLVSLFTIIELRLQLSERGDENSAAAADGDNYHDELVSLKRSISDLDKNLQVHAADADAAKKLARVYEDKFRDTVMQAPIGITILMGRELVVEMANSTYLAIVARTAEDFVGRPLYQVLPEVKGAITPLMNQIFETGEPYYGYEFRVPLHRHGKYEETYFNFVYHPLKSGDDITGVIVVATEVTDYVNSRVALQQREAQFRSLVTQSPIAMTIFRGPEHVIDIANQTMLRDLWRKELHEVEGKKLLDVFPELYDQEYPNLLKKVMDTGVAHKDKEAVAIVNSHDGSRKYYLDYEYAPIFGADGKVADLMVTVNDVSDKVAARQAIEQAEKRYRQLIYSLPVSFFTVDKDGYIEIFNQAAVSLWGRTPVKGVDQWCGAHKLYTLQGDEMPLDISPMAIALKENRSLRREMYVERPDGVRRHVISYPQAVLDDEGNVIGAMNVHIDITDRKETEQALKISEDRFRLLANSMPQMVWTADAAGNLNYFSEPVYEYSGFSEERISREGWLAIVHPDDRPRNIELWTMAVQAGMPFHYEHRFRRHDGEYRWQLSRAIPQYDEKGNIRMWVGTSTDIHDKRVFADELAAQVEERTAELKLSNESLLRSNSELMQFAYVASHDLQEPLRKIQTFVSRIEEMESGTLSEKSKDYFARIQNASARTQKLIKDLLAFSRTNTLEKAFERTDLNDILNKVKDDLNELLLQNQVIINSSELPVLPAISFQFAQLFTNLITNSIKFAKKDVAPVITISSNITEGRHVHHESASPDKTYYHISFSDNGIGFDPQFNERVFLVFQRLHTREAYEGTGIGLAICKRIAENHNGFIAASGVPGKGASFNIYIPQLKTENE